MQVCPSLRSFPQTIADTVRSFTLPLATMVGDLPPELEGDWDEVLARRLHHRSSHSGAPGEDEVIERQGGECGAVAADHGDLFFGKELAEHRPEHGVRRQCEL